MGDLSQIVNNLIANAIKWKHNLKVIPAVYVLLRALSQTIRLV